LVKGVIREMGYREKEERPLRSRVGKEEKGTPEQESQVKTCLYKEPSFLQCVNDRFPLCAWGETIFNVDSQVQLSHYACNTVFITRYLVHLMPIKIIYPCLNLFHNGISSISSSNKCIFKHLIVDMEAIFFFIILNELERRLSELPTKQMGVYLKVDKGHISANCN
jgi:hypothetical protein